MTHFNITVNVTPKEIEKLMTSLQSLTVAINGLQTAVALIPAGAPVAGDPGATAAQVTAAASCDHAAITSVGYRFRLNRWHAHFLRRFCGFGCRNQRVVCGSYHCALSNLR